jgi:thiol-disulfide isomerase/thioredoxin
MSRSLFLSFLIFVLVISVGCSGNSSSPVTPETGDTDLELTGQESFTTENSGPGHSLLGYGECVFDPDTGTLEIVPMRSSELHLNIVKMVEKISFGLSIIPPVTFTDGILDVNLAIQHPLTDMDQFSVFDLKMVIISEGSMTGYSDPDIKVAGPSETRLENADGMTRYWNAAEFSNTGFWGYYPGNLGATLEPGNTAIINGYKLFADGFDMDAPIADLDPATRALTVAGNLNARNFKISFGTGFTFNYAMDASWDVSDPNPPENLPGDFPPTANQPEPWWIEVTEINNTLWYVEPDYGGSVKYGITIHDWQGIDDFGTVTIDCPGIFTMTSDVPVSSTEFTATYNLDVIEPDLTSSDSIEVLVSVGVSGDYDSVLTGVNKPLAAYHMHLTDVYDSDNEKPIAIAEATSATHIIEGETVSFDASASHDPDGTLVNWKWDMNGDGEYNDPFSGSPKTPTATFNEPGIVMVDIMVFDDEGAFDTLDEKIEVLVVDAENVPPVALAEATTSPNIFIGETVTFDASASYDPDGDVVDWKWDFDGDLDYNDTFDGTMQVPTATYNEAGTFLVDLMVIDDSSGWCYLDQKIEIEVIVVPNIPPVADAVATTPTEIDACDSVTFDATGSYDDDGTIDQYLWDFNGDGFFGDSYDSGTSDNPTRNFDEEGSIDVQLKVIDNDFDEDILDIPITITTTNIDPVADAVATTPTTIYSAESVTFSALGSTDEVCDDIVSYEWDFDGDTVFGDSFDSGTPDNPTKVYMSMGTYEVMLRIIDGFGITDETETPITVTVENAPPNSCAEITDPWPYFWNTDIHFSGACSYDVDGTVDLYEWDMDADGTYETTGVDLILNIATAGDYQVQLRVTDDLGVTDLLDAPLAFHIYDDTNTAPMITQVNHSRTTSYTGEDPVSLSVEFIDPVHPSDTHTFLWTCDYGTFDDETSPTPVWTPPNQVVECDITCRVTDNESAWDEGTCQQWVTSYPILDEYNSYSPDGALPSGSLEDIYTSEIYNPTDYIFPNSPDLNGNVVFINIWASWCPPCKAELPHLLAMYNTWKEDDFIFFEHSIQDSFTEMMTYLNANPQWQATYWTYEYPPTYWPQIRQWISPDTGENSIPQSFIFDRDGYVRLSKLGSISSPTYYDAILDELL